jgi:hypothetical protein
MKAQARAITKRFLTRARLSIGVVVAVLATTAFVGSASAGTGIYYPANVACRSDSQTLTMNAQADALPGYSLQWIGTQFYFRNLDTNQGWYSPWTYFQNQFSVTSYGTNSKLGTASLQYTVPQGHYIVYVRYSWWSGSQWINTTGWIQTTSYRFTWVLSGVPFSEAPTTCPVGLSYY